MHGLAYTVSLEGHVELHHCQCGRTFTDRAMLDSHVAEEAARSLARTLPTLYYVPDESELGEDKFRVAPPEVIGAVRQAIDAGTLVVRVGRVEIDAQVPPPTSDLAQPYAFLLGQDASITVDGGKPIRIGSRLTGVTLRIEKDHPIRLVVEGNVRP